LNPIRQELTILWGERKYGIGDEYQAIYAFNGSMSDSLDIFSSRNNAEQLPLSVCWRCPSSHLDLAREIVPGIQDRPNVPKGTLEYYDELSEVVINPEQGALIICRVNAPLIQQFFSLRKIHDNPVVMMSGDVAGTLCNLIGSEYETKSKLDSTWERKYLAKMERKLKYAKTQSSKMVIADHDAQVQLIRANHPELKTVGEFHTIIHEEFDRPEVIPPNAIRMSSVHGSKGLEHNHVILYDTSLMPHPMAELSWEKEQELNLMYVARTRSKDILSIVPNIPE
jgi:superfamily I DNA/RNA helicase